MKTPQTRLWRKGRLALVALMSAGLFALGLFTSVQPNSVRITGTQPDSVRITSVRITGDQPDSVRITSVRITGDPQNRDW